MKTSPRHNCFWIYVAILLVSSFFYLSDLSDLPLWQDEANAALLGKNILTFGVPQVFDGLNYASYHRDDTFVNGVWKLWGWLPLYLNAGMYRISGANTFMARLPYGLMAVLFMLYGFRRLKAAYPSDRTAELFCVLALFCVPFALHVRQCQYYAPSIIVSFLLFYEATRSDFSHSRFWLCLQVVLINTHVLIWFTTNAGLYVILALRCWFNTLFIRAVLLLALKTTCVTLPFFLFYRPWTLAGTYTFLQDQIPFFQKHVLYLQSVLHPFMVLAWGIIIVMIGAWCLKTASRPVAHDCVFGIVFFLVYMTAMTLASGFFYYRYFIPCVLPLLLSVALILNVCFKQSAFLPKFCGFTLLIYYILALRGPSLSESFSLTKLFVQELLTQSEDVNEIVVSFLQTHASPEDTIAMNYGAFPVIYYLNNPVIGGPLQYRLPVSSGMKSALPSVAYPDWVVIRQHFLIDQPYYRHLVSDGYQALTLEGYDTPWGNRPDPYEHHFETPVSDKRIIIYKRTRPSP